MAIRFSYLALSLLLILTISSFANGQPRVHSTTIEKSYEVALIYSETPADDEPSDIMDMMEHLGIIYQTFNENDIANLNLDKYGLAVIVSSKLEFGQLLERSIADALNVGIDIIWIGGGIGGFSNEVLADTFGIKYIRKGNSDEFTISYLDIGQIRSKIFYEEITQVELIGASAISYLVDNNGRKVFPAETFYQKNKSSGKSYFYSYQVHDWWKADDKSPWMRTRELYRALTDCIFDGFSVTLHPYPRNMQMAFICRIEDVTPIHTNEEWLARANDYLDYYSSKGAPLSISLIPLYVDLNQSVTIPLNSTSANSLRQWLVKTRERKGEIVQHGYSHQRGLSRSGITSEFYDEQQGQWASIVEQQRLIELGKKDIYESIGIEVKSFESPHYKANDDTYLALADLGFEYVTHDFNTPFFHQLELSNGPQKPIKPRIINVPETLEYIPLEPPSNFETDLQRKIDDLYEIGGVALFFNHLYNDEASTIGKNLLDYSLRKKGVWLTSVDDLGEFWKMRREAYHSFNVSKNQTTIVTLGKSVRAGLTLKLTGHDEIVRVHINGKPWTLFGEDYVVLPELPHSANIIEIESLSLHSGNSINEMGIPVILMSLVASFFMIRISFRHRKYLHQNI